MNCSIVMELLSDYYDGELEASRRAQVQKHLATCDRCRAKLDEFQELSSFVSGQPVASSSANWLRLESALDSTKEDGDSELVQLAPGSTNSSKFVVWIGIAASILLLAAGVWKYSSKHSGMSHQHEFTAEFGRYLDQFDRDPVAAQEILLQLYEHDRIPAAEMSERLGYSPATSGGLPEGYTHVSTQVLKMPCCTCVQTICERSDGTKIALFEHDDDGSKEWFGERPASMESCNNKVCQLVNLNNKYAATWKRGSRYITLIGVRDKNEVGTFVSWLDQELQLDEG